MTEQHWQFITGRLAEHALRQVVQPLAEQMGFQYTIDVMPITVAALMTPGWVAKRLKVDARATRVLLPGYCEGPLEELQAVCPIPVERGPRDLRDLPEYFGGQSIKSAYGDYDIQILAEINHATRLPLERIRQQARQLARDGADIIDVGCEPGDEVWPGVSQCVRALRDDGLRVSIDSLKPPEIEAAVRAGAELVLSVNSQNCDAAPDWNCPVVVIPDDPRTLHGLDQTVEFLAVRGVPLRIDPILEPIGCGFAASLRRYADVRERYPDAEMLMGIGNLTELTDADSAAINVLLLGICQELQIRSVLTTQVINWARSSVRECDLARRLVHYAVHQGVPPKHLEPQLVMLRDPKTRAFGSQELDALSRQIKDSNFRIFVEGGLLHLIRAGLHLQDSDPFGLFAQLQQHDTSNVDLSHAFYLGYELAKARTALTLDKQYEQDESLDWGMLTLEETSHRLSRQRSNRKEPADE